MQNNPKIIITRHARKRVLERFVPHLVNGLNKRERFEYAEQVIREMWSKAVYYSDCKKGIVFHAPQFKANLFVKFRTITTVNKAKVKQ